QFDITLLCLVLVRPSWLCLETSKLFAQNTWPHRGENVLKRLLRHIRLLADLEHPSIRASEHPSIALPFQEPLQNPSKIQTVCRRSLSSKAVIRRYAGNSWSRLFWTCAIVQSGSGQRVLERFDFGFFTELIAAGF
ncbi:MAG: hypothetical protein AAF074_24380, partial [Pseudomonadota bacterium]